jgi:hypothetical protein
MRAFADALDAVPLTLAENSGLNPIETLASIKSRQVKEKNSRLGVDCMFTGNNGLSFFPYMRYNILMRRRYERTLCHRSSYRETPTTPPCHAIMPNGLEGKLILHLLSGIHELKLLSDQ